MSAVAPFEYLRLPFAVFVGWLIWGEMPVIWTYVGAAIVIASALYIAHREAQLARERRRAALANPQGDQEAWALRSHSRACARCASVMCTLAAV